MGDVIRRGKKDKPRFYIRYKDTDGVRRMKLARGATTKASAQQLLSAAELRVSQGRVGIEEVIPPSPEELARRTITVKELGAAFTERYTTPRLKDAEDYRAEAASVLNARIWPTLGARTAASLTSLDVERLRDKLLEGHYAGATVIGTLACLSRMFVWGKRQGLIDCGNPASGVERPTAAASLDFFSRLEAGQLLELAEKDGSRLWPIVATGLFA
jgi:hypothetical protein